MTFIRRKSFLPLLGIGSFLVFVLWSFPAAIGFSIIAPDQVRGFGIAGSLWNGEAQLIDINGFRIQQARWRVNPLRLVLGSVTGDATARWGNGFVEAKYSLGLNGAVSIRELQASFNLSQLQSQLNVPGISGEMNIRIEKIDWHQGWVREIVGRGEVRNLSTAMIPLGPGQTLGNYELLFDQAAISDATPLTGALRDTGGPLELAGTLILKPPATYELAARIKARPEAPPILTQGITFLPPGPGGTRQLIFADSL